MSEKDFLNIILLIRQSQATALKAVNVELVNLYWQVGEHISKQIAANVWGAKTVDDLAEYIARQHPDINGFSRRGLYRMKQFYETYNNTSIVTPAVTQLENIESHLVEIVTPVVSQFILSDIRRTLLCKISWSHHLLLMSRAKSEEERLFYLQLCIKERYSKRELDRQISVGLFERVMIGNHTLPNAIQQVNTDIASAFKDTYIFEFLNLPEPHSEGDLQKGLIKQMKHFILELGKDFLYAGEEYKVLVGNSDFYIDLLFYHRGLQCLVAFELKADKFKPEHLGKLEFYLEALDRNVKKPNENPSIGILLCKDKDSEVVEYALSRSMSPAMVAEYKTQLPDKKLLEQKLHELFENSDQFR